MARSKVRKIILIDPTKIHVKVDRRNPNGGFAKECYRKLSEVIKLPEIETDLPLGDIYDGLKFEEK